MLEGLHNLYNLGIALKMSILYNEFVLTFKGIGCSVNLLDPKIYSSSVLHVFLNDHSSAFFGLALSFAKICDVIKITLL